MWDLVKRGWRFLLEVHSIYGLIADLLAALGLSGLLTIALHYFGEHSAALLAIVFGLVAGVLVVASLAVMGRQAARLPRRMPLLQFVRRALKTLDIGEDSLEVLDFAHALRQAGLDGAIRYFGNEGRGALSREFVGRNFPLVEIPAETFRTHSIDLLEIARGDNNLNTTLQAVSAGAIFTNIHLNPDQARIWLRREARDIIKAIPKRGT